jgi:hypothetical protein
MRCAFAFGAGAGIERSDDALSTDWRSKRRSRSLQARRMSDDVPSALRDRKESQTDILRNVYRIGLFVVGREQQRR